ncbi:Alpha/Beta hydrolase protein [Tribonema minus]|uniref:Alpha/Beta hydrolase protein n=1 Tax=Tribonema minus TaxID=303371 RepID=A0A836CKI9_9STRA|nr:Alpha/Beta hydrolase protein [Tribonema minus]
MLSLIPAAAAGFCGLLAISVGTLVSYTPAQNLITYAHWLSFRQPLTAELTDLRAFRLHGTRNVNVTTSDGLRLYGWHLLPNSRIARVSAQAGRALEDGDFEGELADAERVVVYFHGNAATRGVKNRVDLVKTLAGVLDAHVMAFDYRGFGDSEGTPTEGGLLLDALAIWGWVKARVGPDTQVYVYGQSLGTAVAIKLAAALAEDPARPRLPAGLILDAPFTDLKTAARHHPSTLPFRLVPGLYGFIAARLAETWDSAATIARARGVRLLILHGRRDAMMAHAVGEALAAAAAAALGADAVRFASFARGGHKDLFTFELWVREVGGFTGLAPTHVRSVGGTGVWAPEDRVCYASCDDSAQRRWHAAAGAVVLPASGAVLDAGGRGARQQEVEQPVQLTSSYRRYAAPAMDVVDGMPWPDAAALGATVKRQSGAAVYIAAVLA